MLNRDQQCSRAFAAELLIPQEVVLNAINSESDPDEFDRQVDILASDFKVSTQAVHWQFQHGVKGS